MVYIAAVSDLGIHNARTKNKYFVHRWHVFVNLTDFKKFYKIVICCFCFFIKKTNKKGGLGLVAKIRTLNATRPSIWRWWRFRQNVRRFLTKVEWWVSGEHKIFILPLSFYLSHSRIRSWNSGQCSLLEEMKNMN